MRRHLQPASRKYSALVAPRVPAEKLSMKRTVCFSVRAVRCGDQIWVRGCSPSGTVVPPEDTSTTLRPVAACCEMKSRASDVCCSNPLGGGFDWK
jgi:hypothetical protein